MEIIVNKPEHVTYEMITDLLHMAYAEWIEKGLLFAATTQSPQETESRIGKDGKCVVVLKDDKLIGTLSFKLCKWDKWYVGKNSVIIFMFAIHPDFKRSGVGSRLLMHPEEQANNYDSIILDTAASARYLIKFYEKRGYKKVDFISWKNTNYYSIVFWKILTRSNNYSKYHCWQKFQIARVKCIVMFKPNGVERLYITVIKKIIKYILQKKT
jgi:ribosomal protein S18 acetylase RimI-like enzyme